MTSNNTAKFTFLYLLSLIALGFFAISAGNILFQLINKNIADIVESYNMLYNIQALRFAISAIIVSAPIYFVTVWQINKNLANGLLEKDSGIRKWLTYLILLVSALVIIGDLIAVIYNFLNGELSLKFSLKTLTILAIAGVVFSYYFYDMKREKIEQDKVVNYYFYLTAVLAIIIFISGIFFVESPAEARQKRLDNEVVNALNAVESAIQEYYMTEEKLPENLDVLIEDIDYIQGKDLQNVVTKKEFEYKITSEREYELCTEFLRSNMEDKDNYSYGYLEGRYRHEAGYDCLKKKVNDDTVKPMMVR
ncbi:hypothetical protein COT99_00330 [Candidatus Falkowbacteria bacterium CG10_big_fil_rev_8_21_14_0_10_43_10]|uniref:DUF5671 domain-containing protein n=1 Tax=Candidatus Falkowbacteria bacterium CG10_big_fil_rev_8_21_14_0_10_43_10 TaxID=1974567 RepID=A0A2H0V356_9BACT|nr:MAG: hypothetical protein COT99_00330 [Candidatus Falkowbacteria bacterium CG10_big_fil_rev_8_21_14_0_10_43_10]